MKARRLQVFFLEVLKSTALNTQRRKIDWPAPEPHEHGQTKIVEKRLKRRERQIVLDYLTIRKILYGVRLMSHPRGYIVKTHKERARAIVLQTLETTRVQNILFAKFRETYTMFQRIQVRSRQYITRKRYKKRMLRYYWDTILERMEYLENRKILDQLKKFNGEKLSVIPA